MLRNVPYFKNLKENIINDLVYLLKPCRYEKKDLIVKRG
jgi:hypothetical protein